jgi:hypothetical protein
MPSPGSWGKLLSGRKGDTSESKGKARWHVRRNMPGTNVRYSARLSGKFTNSHATAYETVEITALRKGGKTF